MIPKLSDRLLNCEVNPIAFVLEIFKRILDPAIQATLHAGSAAHFQKEIENIQNLPCELVEKAFIEGCSIHASSYS
jgi:hypothetical protein